ncbi:3D domain-containing protein [Paenibacillus protaetiae]|uniref:LysM peptidoglycan-binding domain-containing protein n=1 Tax=Paenibacillus protaetiae TaxID=2509456 RepID=A0A4P6F4S5_9BACL|nr:3D domain-containing protein [Paenibacillus protaetiae]QAY68187.1 LysM peptidoglycan-binding domain-containing protein [Paenibacillus protaetiae]
MKKIITAAASIGLALMLAGGPAHAAQSTYTAKEGDTFWSLAQKNGITISQLQSANPKINPLNIYAGLKIAIPSPAAKAATAKTAAAGAVTAKAASAQSIIAGDGTSYAFSKTLTVKATAYSSAASENGKWGAVDYFGNPLKLGTIAVDPSVIPLGTKLYVTGYGSHKGLPDGGFVAKATDTGGAIKGNRIDIFIPGTPAEVSTFGIQNIKVYILK